jgi:hypothetical protein
MDIARARIRKIGWWWLGGLLACVLVSWLLSWFDTTTELVPDHARALDFGFIAACGIAAVSVPLMFWQSSGPWPNRILLCLLGVPLIAFFGIFLLAGEALALVSARVDFPPAQTQRFDGILMISRAYQTHGKGRHWNIQTTPIWANLRIAEADYRQMRDHRSPEDPGRDPDEIASDGYFCARVEAERAGNALRILHAGNYDLPQGMIGICAELIALNPTLPVIGFDRSEVAQGKAGEKERAR